MLTAGDRLSGLCQNCCQRHPRNIANPVEPRSVVLDSVSAATDPRCAVSTRSARAVPHHAAPVAGIHMPTALPADETSPSPGRIVIRSAGAAADLAERALGGFDRGLDLRLGAAEPQPAEGTECD